jgi:hypothetical protein
VGGLRYDRLNPKGVLPLDKDNRKAVLSQVSGVEENGYFRFGNGSRSGETIDLSFSRR